ncbi:2-dehydro-3-deoxyphosphogluconate aldolase/(4S)-4-hydroxy-2-oxoglutarate aldolase [Nocardioides sp. J9]|uniref:bifunctional 4-hydroxy-2-oxoglutarate aldolase/2-dehydro-3-deoxy-phosphogluconate aldolase n=1 Tax=unclassified Nocardioides TaxID=2615069 RepID=UPI0004BB891C|nr:MULTISPECIES: bifunctional 4-hydroxy-2-oxoglutarate aldolase/2-dehydro-3-deoxy-phosphogluconate aldolase [unclassified Nocardioides]TWH04719.1 2-dehydro-3-deoxyphosphogluconate aldolase/(4S)-4-hydroxy-2-oxoglutarate aldolase [Nocardioides sp. J9]
MTHAAEVLGRHRVVPVVVLGDVDRADGLGEALVRGGLPVAEVTFRSPDAAAVLRRLADRGDLVVGAGTVLTAEQVDLAHRSGAGFVVSPGLSVAVVHRCRALGLPVLPGVSTASEIMRALDQGLDLVKFFPAEPSGGLPAISALAAAFPQVTFVPTGGISARLAPDYLAHPAVAAVGGSWMVPPDLLRAGRWDEVTDLCATTVAAVPGALEPLVPGTVRG